MYWMLAMKLLLLNHLIGESHIALAELNAKPKTDEILNFLSKNGNRHLLIVTLDDDRRISSFQNRLLEVTKKKDIFSRKIKAVDSNNGPVPSIMEKLDFYKDSLLILASSEDTKNWDLYFELLGLVETMSATMILCEPIEKEQKNVFLSKLEVSSKSRFFYWLYENANERNKISYNRVITILNVEQIVVNSLSFNNYGHIIEDYDLQGMHILSTTVSWPPYIFLSEGCKNPKNYNDECKAYGHLVDALNVMGRMSNFTWECHGDPNDDYGTTPLSGPANASGTWGGVVGDVFYGKYQFSMSTWVWKEERQDMFDFASIVTDQSALGITLKAKDIDYTLFTRPFRLEVWLLIGFIVITFLLATIVPYLFAPNFGKSNSYRMIVALAFLFFMLTEIYYSGALTMFFSTAPQLPFDPFTIEEVMREYPTWKLIMRYGNDVYYVNKVQEGDPDYVEFWNRVKNEPEESVFKSVNEGMEKVLNGFYVAQMQEGSIKGWIRENPIRGEKVLIGGRGRASYYTLITTNNSPLAPVFRASTRTMIEKGVLDRINSKWIETKKSAHITDLESTLIVLKPGQMILMYFLVMLMVIVTVIVFILEQVWKHLSGDKIKRKVENKIME